MVTYPNHRGLDRGLLRIELATWWLDDDAVSAACVHGKGDGCCESAIAMGAYKPADRERLTEGEGGGELWRLRGGWRGYLKGRHCLRLQWWHIIK